MHDGGFLSDKRSSLRRTARKLGVGKAVRVLYHTPVANVRKSFREGGPLEQRRMRLGRQEMASALLSMPPVDAPQDASDVELHILTGAKYWDLTAAFTASFQRHSPNARVVPILYSDGTLTDANVGAIARLLPATRVERLGDVEARIDAALPASRFPTLRALRPVFTLARKLMDVHAGRQGVRLVVDSDMLVFREPTRIIEWVKNPAVPIHMEDVGYAYGYPKPLLDSLLDRPIRPLVNVGILGLRSDDIDWDQVERWATVLQEHGGRSYYLEQVLSAMIVNRFDCVVVRPPDYIVLPTLEEGRRPTAVLHHYVENSKRSYFQHSWKVALGVDE